jgi:predicted metal-dependent HD superfamily phosphohydrolase
MKDIFLNLATPYCNETKALHLWDEIALAYNHKNRHYHNLEHLQNMFNALLPVKEQIDDWDTMLFALFYHDAVYSATKKDNELKSSKMAINNLRSIGYDAYKTSLCLELIMATQHHSASGIKDINLFTDADLSILGQPWEVYETYCKNVRKEYNIYPDLLYNPGRKKALGHFLEMDTIFKTEHFKEHYEDVARLNISKEIKFL